jgi:hypothetical protein
MEEQVPGGPRIQISLQPQAQTSFAPRSLGQVSIAPDGQFEIQSVQPGSYYLLAVRLQQGGPPTQRAVIPLTVTNSDVDGIVIMATDSPQMQVTGTVKVEGQESGRLSLNVMLQLVGGLPFGGPPLPPGRVQSDGSFEVDNVPPGKYAVNVAGLPSGSFVKQIRAGAADILASGLDLTQPQAPPPLDILIGRNAAVLNGIVREGDQPKARAYVTLFAEPMRPEARQLQRTAVSGADGSFQLNGVVPGAYRIYAWGEPVQPSQLQPDDLKPYEAESVAITLDEGEEKHVDLKAIPPQ